MFKLVIQDDEGKTTVVPLIRDEITIGRKEGNTIRLTERNVSRRHARILRNNGEVHIEDLGSYNGIRVNNARIAERVSLRVSDQVQIGDYKLYLKAEGVEQVDDARTMPIERVGVETGGNTATDIIAVAPGAAPTTPMAAVATPTMPQGIPATPSPVVGPRMVGDPNRTLVAVADTDPHGRPVASAAQVAALSAPVGYGKLVVLSSNFAGKEFELSRPQMIVGRTDENDIVVNHRSISRNHAKLVREPDTGRYTISDLQSSNGVRVNGQDYGKVELRRGDVIDLGHVRLRFVEPGEDFVFSRDAVITDVPETGGKRGLLVAVVLGFLVVAAIAVYFVTKGPSEGDGPKSGSNPVVGETPDAIVVAEAKDAAEVAPDVGDPTLATGDEKDKIKECQVAAGNLKWLDLEECGHALAKMNPGKGNEFVQKGKMESKAEAAKRNFDDALNLTKEIKKARNILKQIPDESVYHKDATKALEKAEQDKIESLTADLKLAIAAKDCARYNTRAANDDKAFGGKIAEEAKAKAGPCQSKPAGCTADSCASGFKCENERCVKIPVVAKTCVDTGCGAGFDCDKSSGKCKAVPVVKPPVCDPAEVQATFDRATASQGQGNYAAALQAFESILTCKPSAVVNAYMAACHARRFDKARKYFLGVPKDKQDYFAQICLKDNCDPRTGGGCN